MLQLKNITKTYAEKSDGEVAALKGISLAFRPSEFVSILGPSGCGKTTLLNIIGGLDRYSDGDLLINGVSTKTYRDKDWDTYRNHSIGFVFQSYNLIPHLTILENVELSMTLAGVPKADRRKRAKEALIRVGLKEKLNKKPNQLSGGQMQRVSIARAIVNNPAIILADEPTGALDSETSITVMELLKEISETKLVIMVTHNPDLAEKYSDRIIRMLDGEVTEDTSPLSDDELAGEEALLQAKAKAKSERETDAENGVVKYKKKHSSMSFRTALALSAKNLLSKKRRTAITSIAASIGIIGIAVILSVSTGLQSYIDQTMLNSASFNYISISATVSQIPDIGSQGGAGGDAEGLEEYPENTTGIYPYEVEKLEQKKQKLDKEFIDYLENKCDGLVIDIAYSYSVDLNIITKSGDKYISVNSSNWNEALSNAEYLQNSYTVLASDGVTETGIPTATNEVALVVDKYNRLSTSTLDALGIAYDETLSQIDYTELIGKEFRIVFNDGWYTPVQSGDITLYQPANSANYQAAYENENGMTVKIVSVLREREDAAASWLSEGIAYSPALTEQVLAANKTSAVASAQAENTEIDVTTGKAFGDGAGTGFPGMSTQTLTYEAALETLGYTQTPSSILIYPTDVDNRELIIGYLDAWNEVNEGNGDTAIDYMDMSSTMTSMLGSVVKIVTYVLVAFSVTSLIISSIMIAIIIYASVIERTKEIGVLRSIGARKKDIGRVFKAEAVLLGVVSGLIAILTTLVINVVINAILANLVGVSTIASLSALTAIGLIALSAILLLIASLIPARMAAKKEPAVALRTE
mgnify:FL=1